ncbi:MAG TPA: enoyl-CoA hydratase-related protein [Dehalococcoidia bacterium]|nr:enoyl-CoA hydratase-related protein [Dehalococcoidia bacterium]
MDRQWIDLVIDGAVATVTMNRAPANAINAQFRDELIDAFEDAYVNHEGVKVVILASRLSTIYSAGADVKEFPNLAPRAHLLRYRRIQYLFDWLYNFPLPTVAAIHGYALAGGFVLAACCDIRVAADDTTFGLPEISVGSIGGISPLFRLVPQGYARWLALTGRQVPASELYRLGAIEQVVPRADLPVAAREVANEIARVPQTALRFAKRAMNEAEVLPLVYGVANELGYSAEFRGSNESIEAARAFSEKREPRT